MNRYNVISLNPAWTSSSGVLNAVKLTADSATEAVRARVAKVGEGKPDVLDFVVTRGGSYPQAVYVRWTKPGAAIVEQLCPDA